MALPSDLEIRTWPGAERRDPPISSHHYLILGALARLLRDELESRFAGRADLRVLDLGCGCKPYLPLFAGKAATYRGLDLAPGPFVDDVGTLHALPYGSASADVVICTQVFEHVADPGAAAREIARVLAPGGVALVSTHGVFPFHPDPPNTDADYWRWTHAGLDRLFRTAGDWSELVVTPNGEAVACLASVACLYMVEAACRVDHSGRLARACATALNLAARRLDTRLPPRAREGRPGSLSANYLVTAVRA